MALAGVLQGIGVGMMWGSWAAVGAILFGGLVWDRCIRPVEEADLRARFGDSYRVYARDVGCWVVW